MSIQTERSWFKVGICATTKKKITAGLNVCITYQKKPGIFIITNVKFKSTKQVQDAANNISVVSKERLDFIIIITMHGS